MMLIDLKQLDATIAAAPVTGPVAIITRAWLEQVQAELRSGRAAAAELARQTAFGDVLDGLGREGASR